MQFVRSASFVQLAIVLRQVSTLSTLWQTINEGRHMSPYLSIRYTSKNCHAAQARVNCQLRLTARALEEHRNIWSCSHVIIRQEGFLA